MLWVRPRPTENGFVMTSQIARHQCQQTVPGQRDAQQKAVYFAGGEYARRLSTKKLWWRNKHQDQTNGNVKCDQGFMLLLWVKWTRKRGSKPLRATTLSFKKWWTCNYARRILPKKILCSRNKVEAKRSARVRLSYERKGAFNKRSKGIFAWTVSAKGN